MTTGGRSQMNNKLNEYQRAYLEAIKKELEVINDVKEVLTLLEIRINKLLIEVEKK